MLKIEFTFLRMKALNLENISKKNYRKYSYKTPKENECKDSISEPNRNFTQYTQNSNNTYFYYK